MSDECCVGPRKFRVRLVCCGRDAGLWPQPPDLYTWHEADTFRNDYVDAEGHVRVGIIESVWLG